MAIRKSPLLISKMPDGYGLFLFCNELKLYQPMNTVYRKEHIRESRSKTVFNAFGFPTGTHPLAEICPKFALIHPIIITHYCCKNATCLSQRVLFQFPLPCFNRGVVDNSIKDTTMKNKFIDIAVYVFTGTFTIYFAYLLVEQLSN